MHAARAANCHDFIMRLPGEYETVAVDLVRGTAPVGSCTNGGHLAQSAGRFGITVWGYDSASSYAYPAGASVQPINSVVVPPTPP